MPAAVSEASKPKMAAKKAQMAYDEAASQDQKR